MKHTYTISTTQQIVEERTYTIMVDEPLDTDNEEAVIDALHDALSNGTAELGRTVIVSDETVQLEEVRKQA